MPSLDAKQNFWAITRRWAAPVSSGKRSLGKVFICFSISYVQERMKICSRCGTPARDAHVFCTECGERFPTEEEEQRVSEEVYRESDNDAVDMPPAPYLESYHVDEPEPVNRFKDTLEGIKWMKRYFALRVFLGAVPYVLMILFLLVVLSLLGGGSSQSGGGSVDLYYDMNTIQIIVYTSIILTVISIILAIVSIILLILGILNIHKGMDEYDKRHPKYVKMGVLFLFIVLIPNFMLMGSTAYLSGIYSILIFDSHYGLFGIVLISLYVAFFVIEPLGYVFSVLELVTEKMKKLLVAGGVMLGSIPVLLIILFLIMGPITDMSYIYILLIPVFLTAMAHFLFYIVYKDIHNRLSREGIDQDLPTAYPG